MQMLDNRSHHHNALLGRRVIGLVLSFATVRWAASVLVLLGVFVVFADAAPSSSPSSASLVSLSSSPLFKRFLERRDFKLILDYDSPTPSPEEGPPLSAGALRDPAFLPAQIGAIIGAYAISLVLVASALLALTRRRKSRLDAAEELEVDENGGLKLPTFDCPFGSYPNVHSSFPDVPSSFPDGAASKDAFPYPINSPRSPRNFSYPSLASPTRSDPPQYFVPSPTSTIAAPGVDLSVDQDVVASDRRMAQQQLEDMYRLVMEQEAAKEAGIILDAPVVPASRKPALQPQLQQQQQQRLPQPPASNASTSTLTKKEKKFKPAHLNLEASGKADKPQSRTSSILSVLKSPRRKKPQMQGISISSPIMTPMSGAFPRGPDGEEMSAIPPRHYAPAAPPPVPLSAVGANVAAGTVGTRRATGFMPPTPELSPNSTQSIDERIGSQLASVDTALARQAHHAHSRTMSSAPSEVDPASAVSERSTTPLIGLPSSPKSTTTRFPPGSLGGAPSLPSSPKPGATFQRAPAPSAVRTGGTLPLRAYEQPLASPSAIANTTKQTTFERMGPMSPNGQRTPFTGMAVPYSPYQPFSPVIPMTPSLVTKADRKRMKRLEPKTPTMEMVRSNDDIW